MFRYWRLGVVILAIFVVVGFVGGLAFGGLALAGQGAFGGFALAGVLICPTAARTGFGSWGDQVDYVWLGKRG